MRNFLGFAWLLWNISIQQGVQSNTSVSNYYHDMRVPFIISLTDSHNNLLNWYDDSYFTEEEFEYSKGQSLVKGGLTQPITSLVAPLQSERLSRDR